MFLAQDCLWVLVLALIFDGLTGDPDLIWKRMPHPAVLMGKAIAMLDLRVNDAAKSDVQRRTAGVLALALLIGLAFALGLVFQIVLTHVPVGSLVLALVASTFFAQRSLYEHIELVRRSFSGDLSGARIAVARVVGRDTENLDVAEICRAAIESCAENFGDGVVAPAFWFALLGLPGLAVYKIVNTADSMIGHKTPRHEAFGWATARFDDLLNFVPARLSGVFLSLAAPIAGGSIGRALAIMWQDAGRHRSPNAGWPESAAAGALDIALSGPRHYAGQIADEPFLNPAGRAAEPDDIKRALRLLLAACGLEIVVYAALALSL